MSTRNGKSENLKKFKPYLDYIENLKKYFDELVFVHLTRKNNQVADALATLATLASIWDNLKGLLVRLVILIKARVSCFESTQVLTVVEENKLWYSDILKLIECGEFSENAIKKDRMLLRSLTKRFFIFNGVLYKRDKALHLRCVSEKEVEQIMRDVHIEVCGMNGKEFIRKIIRQGYYWLTIEHDCIQFVRSCHEC